MNQQDSGQSFNWKKAFLAQTQNGTKQVLSTTFNVHYFMFKKHILYNVIVFNYYYLFICFDIRFAHKVFLCTIDRKFKCNSY